MLLISREAKMNALPLLALSIIITVTPIRGHAATAVCVSQPEVTINYADPSIIPELCDSSARALSILGDYGLVPRRQITIDIIESEINHLGYMAYGTYNSRTDRITLMSYEAILQKHEEPKMYGEFFDQAHYRGALAHEIAHAVFHHHSLNMSPGPAPQEYLAHAVQLASLPTEKRSEIINRMGSTSWESGDAISDVYMALEPTGFAVKSYMHLTTTDNPQAFIDILLNSKWFYVYIP